MSRKKKIMIAVCVIFVLGAIGNMSDGDSGDQEQTQETNTLEKDETMAENVEDKTDETDYEEDEKGEKNGKEDGKEDAEPEEKEMTKEEQKQQEKERKAEQKKQEQEEIKDIIDGFTGLFAGEPDQEDIDKLKDYNQKLVFKEFNRQIKKLNATSTSDIKRLLTAFGMAFPDYKGESDQIIEMANHYDDIEGSIDFSDSDIDKVQKNADSLENDIARAVSLDVYIYQEIDMRLLGNISNWVTGGTVYQFETVDGMEGALYAPEKFPEAGYYSIRCIDLEDTLAVEDEQGFGRDIPKYEYLPDSTEEELEQAKERLERMREKAESRDLAKQELQKCLKQGFSL